MKKFLAVFVLLFMVIVSLPLAADAQCRKGRSYSSRNYNARNYSRNNYRYANNRYNSNRNYSRRNYGTAGYVYERPSFYRRHRNLINLGVATGGGALIGALTGGKRGALIGTAIGAGSGALYTYVLNKKQRRYRR